MKEYLSFDEGSRIEGFHDFQDEQQFAPEAQQLVRGAAAEVERYRNLFPSVRAVADHYLQNPPEEFWPSFGAGVACGLVGDRAAANLFFRNVIEPKDDDRDWVWAAQADAEQLDRIVPDVGRFREIVAERVERTRELQKLPRISVDWDTGGEAAAPR